MCEVRLEGQRFDEDACRSQRRIEIFVGQVSLKERHFQGGSAVLKIYGNEFVDLNTRYLQLYRERKNQQWPKKNRKSP